jgi:homoserine kinase
MTPATHPGLLGICLSGAGPTILALVSNESNKSTSSDDQGTISTDSSEITLGEGVDSTKGKATPQMKAVGEAIKELWKQDGIEVEWLALEVDNEGATLKEIK